MIKAIIIEDEANSRALLLQMLEEYCEGIVIEGMAVDVPSGIGLIKEIKPDVVFLDVEMPGGTGFDVLKAFENIDFKVVFVTGYDHYAIKAIKFAALDYLLKPVNLEELRSAVEKIKVAIPSYGKRLDFIKNEMEKSPDEVNKIVITDNKNHQVVKFEDVVFIEAERTYATFHLIDDQKVVAANPLNFFEEILPASIFFRIHKSYLINCHKVTKLDVGRGGPVHLYGGAQLPVAYRRKVAFVSFLEKIA